MYYVLVTKKDITSIGYQRVWFLQSSAHKKILQTQCSLPYQSLTQNNMYLQIREPFCASGGTPGGGV